MDIKQEEITTLHQLCVDDDKIKKCVRESVTNRPVSLVMPMLYREIKNDALGNIVKQ